jgi:hypothetical protein
MSYTIEEKEKEKTFWFHIASDYRSGRSIYTYTKPPKYDNEDEDDEDDDNEEDNNEEDNDNEEDDDDEDAPEEATDIKFALPKEGIRIYIVNEFPNYQPIWYKDVDGDTTPIYLKIFSQIHESLPFVVTGMTSGYKEEGYYPDIPEYIQAMPDVIDKELVNKISELEDDGYYFVFVVDSNGYAIQTELLNPIF